jgi:DNA invertase Pin-like site-specific DNA recombinase/DNA-binding CsgD family transcriptional regulator
MPDRLPNRCAIYTRKSSEEGLEQSFNSLDAQREACAAYILSQHHEGWEAMTINYDDGGFSGGNMRRPALKRLLTDITAGLIDTVLVYKVDRLTRSLADFSKLVEHFDKHSVGFLAVSQPFNTTSSIGRLTLNVLLSFAQFEREVTGERIRDKIAASKRRGIWMGGNVPLGYEAQGRKLVVNPEEAALVVKIFEMYLELDCITKLRKYLEQAGHRTKKRLSPAGRVWGDKPFRQGTLYCIMKNCVYLGDITHKGAVYPGQHLPIIERAVWNKVQEKILKNLQTPRKLPTTIHPHLLRGFLFDREGNRFYPLRTKKKGKSYRYYATKVRTGNVPNEGISHAPLPATKIEELVLSQLAILLKSFQRMMGIFVSPEVSPSEMRSAVEAIGKWNACTPDTVRNVLRIVLKKVTVNGRQIEIQIYTQALRRIILGITDPGEQKSNSSKFLTIDVAAELRTDSVLRLIVPCDSRTSSPAYPSAIVRAIAKAHGLVELILSGEAATLKALAIRVGLSERNVKTLIRLAFIAPDITESILANQAGAPELPISCLGKISMDWQVQRKVYRADST